MTTRKKRNYKAEYKRRIERALKLGYSRSVARGHPKTKTIRFTDSKGNKRTKKEMVELGIRGAKFLGERPGESLKKIVARDARYTFGRKKPKRIAGEDRTSSEYQLRLEELIKRDDGKFDWTNEAKFIEQMRAAGATEREAYTFWFSP